MTTLHITGTAWGPRCECPEIPRAHYHGSAFLIQDAADGFVHDEVFAERCNECEKDKRRATA